MNMKKVILIYGEDWQGLFINGVLVDEGHSLNGAYTMISYLKNITKKYNFNIEDIIEKQIDEKDTNYLYDYGCFPFNLSTLKGIYDKED